MSLNPERSPIGLTSTFVDIGSKKYRQYMTKRCTPSKEGVQRICYNKKAVER